MVEVSAAEVFLVGSGHGDVLEKLAARALAAVKAKKATEAPRVAVSYAPMADSQQGLGFMKKVAASVFPGAIVTPFAVRGEPHATAESKARAIVEEADLVFVSGGDPVLGARLLCDAGADAWLRDARARGAPIMGVSAGSIVLGAYWAEWPEEAPSEDPNEGATLVRCTGVAGDLVLDTHNEEDEWDELHAVRRLVHASRAKARFVGIPTGAAIVVAADGRFESVGSAPVVLE